MMRSRKVLSVILGAAFLLILGAMFGPRTAHALVATLVQVVPGNTTHLGQLESNMVQLTCFNKNIPNCYSVSPTNGEINPTVYIVPVNMTLIITDWQWRNSASALGVFLQCDLLGQVVSGDLLTAYIEQDCATADANGNDYHDLHFTSGHRLASGSSLFDDFAYNSGSAYIHGYLVPSD